MKNQTLQADHLSSYQDPESQIQQKSTDSGSEQRQQMKKVHILLQGKGGIGKSFVALVLAQYIKQHDPDVLCIDTDPVNATFSSFAALHVHPLALLENESNRLVEGGFDKMMEQIVSTESNVVVDNGAASYVPLSTYLIDNEAFNVIQNAGKPVIIHSVIAGGMAQDNTVSDFGALTAQLPEGVGVVVWLNEYLGQIEAKGKPFEEMRSYLDNKHRVIGIVRLPKRIENTYGKDVTTMMKRHFTFEEALQSDEFFLMSKQRLKIVQRSIYEQLEMVL